MIEDLRGWMKRAEKIGELTVIEGADLKYEMGTISQLTAKNRGPAILHQKIQGYPPKFGVITNLMSSIKNINLTWGLPAENTLSDTVQALRNKVREWESVAPKYPPRIVKDGPITENIVIGDKIDLGIFPTPTWHELDGGPYIGTAVSVITKDPDTGQVNYGTYRGQLLDRRSVGMMISQGHHGAIHYNKYFERGQPCPMAMVFGTHPLLFAVSASNIPMNIAELNYAGGIIGESIPVIEGRVTGLPIPANGEIAIEGFVDPKERRLEGDFGEWPGYYAGGKALEPFLKAETLYYRNDPILCGSPPAPSVYFDFVLARCTWSSALLYNEMLAANIPEIRGVWFHPVGGGHHLVAVSIKQRYDGHATQAGLVAAQAGTGAMQGRYTVVVDEDINPYDLEDVMWAVCSRSRPIEMDFIKKAWSTRTDPSVRRPTDRYTTSRAIIYAVKPYEERNEYPQVCLASEASRQAAFNRWQDVLKGRWQTT